MNRNVTSIASHRRRAADRFAACAAVLLAAATGAGCGSGSTEAPETRDKPSGTTRYENPARGFEITIPDGWRRAERSLTPRLTDPRERVSVGTFPLRYRRTNCEAFAGGAQQDLGDTDVFFTLLERGTRVRGASRDHPARPKRIGPSTGRPLDPTDCPRSQAKIQWIEFTDAGRHFNVLLAFGRSVPAVRRRAAYRMLDSLRFDPKVRPDWPASP